MDEILKRLDKIEQLILSQNMVQKNVLAFNDACSYLELSPSHLYKLTSAKKIPHFCPQGKKLYFNRHELDAWLQRNRQQTVEEMEDQAGSYLMKKVKA